MELQQAIEEITRKIDCITAEDFGEGYFITQQVRDRYYYRKGEAVGLRKALDIMEKVELPKGKRWIVSYGELFLAKPVETDEENVFSVAFQKEYAHQFESNEEAYKNSKLVSPFAIVEEVEIDE